ncbi:MAG TPA: amino acid adenylation domain-containing protein [Planctomycetota bacterium]|jgi:amino acid adenylation domain-containing protein
MAVTTLPYPKFSKAAVLTNEDIAARLDYWKSQLDGFRPALQFETSETHAEVPRSGLTLTLHPQMREKLARVSQNAGVSDYVVFAVALQLLLQRYCQHDEVILFSTERHAAETTLWRGGFAGNPTVAEVLARAGRAEKHSSSYALPTDVVLEKLPEWLAQPWHFVHLTRFGAIEKFALSVEVQETETAFAIRFEYKTALISEQRTACLLEQYSFLLEQIAANPSAPIETLSLAPPEHLRRLPDPTAPLEEKEFPSIAELIARHVEQAPEAVAIAQGPLEFTYRQLWDSSGAIAQHLIARGIGKGQAVAITGERSAGLVAGMLGILRAGAILLPLAPDLPAARQERMLAIADARMILCMFETQGSLAHFKLPSVLVDPQSGALAETGAPSRACSVLPQLLPGDPAYLFFTSGTTGVPKGVLGCHRGLSHFLDWQSRQFQITAGDRIAQLTSLSFTVVLRETFVGLVGGATLCIPPTPQDRLPDRLAAWMARAGVNVVTIVPSVAHNFLASIPANSALPKLRCTFFNSEPLSHKVVTSWRRQFPSTQIVHLYGATETSMAKCFYVVPEEVLPGLQPAGWPVPHAQVLVLSPSGQRCGFGEIGEVVVRTPYLTLGYLNAPEETAKRFVRNPFTDRPRDMLYHTGDRGRIRLDGALDVLGRADEQIKIHGIRIEPGEIQAILQQHPAVASCVVLVTENPTGEKTLVACVVPARGAKPATSELRQFLGTSLPQIMIPTRFITLETLPVTMNGKLDRAALPRLEFPEPEQNPRVAPRTPLECVLTKLWAEVLNLEEIGVFDNFFDMGGHSLLAFQAISRMRDALGIEPSIRWLFDAPTVAGLAELLVKDPQQREAMERKAAALCEQYENAKLSPG